MTMMSSGAVLVLSPHSDDAELGCGGYISRLQREGRDVFVACFSTAEASLPPGSPPGQLRVEFEHSMAALGLESASYRVLDFPVRHLAAHRQEILEILVALRREVDPSIVLAPASTDTHQDHQVLHNEGLRAFRDMTILGYELPWNHVSFNAQGFVRLEDADVERKWFALSHYKTQLELGRPYFSRDFVYSLATVRGTQAKTKLAEAFEVTRIKW